MFTPILVNYDLIIKVNDRFKDQILLEGTVIKQKKWVNAKEVKNTNVLKITCKLKPNSKNWKTKTGNKKKTLKLNITKRVKLGQSYLKWLISCLNLKSQQVF